MRVDLRLQCLDARLLQSLLLQVGTFKLVLQFGGHAVKMAVDPLKLAALGLCLDLIAALAVLKMYGCVHQHVDRLCHMLSKQQNHHSQQRQHQQHDRQNRFLQAGHIVKQIVRCRTCIQRKTVIGQVSDEVIIIAIFRMLRLFPQAARIQHKLVKGKPGPVRQNTQCIKQHLAVHKLHNGRVRLKLVVQQIAGDIQIAVHGKKTDFRVGAAHGLQNDRFCTVMVVSGKAVSADAAAHYIRIDAHLVPEADKHGLVPLFPSKVLGEVVIGAAVQGGFIPILLPAAVSAAYHTVIADRLGIGESPLKMGFQLLQGIIGIGFQPSGHLIIII